MSGRRPTRVSTVGVRRARSTQRGPTKVSLGEHTL